MLTIQTPYQIADCGCTLETGDRNHPLFIPCKLHSAAETMLDLLSNMPSLWNTDLWNDKRHNLLKRLEG